MRKDLCRWSWLLLLIVGFSTGCRKDSPSPDIEPLLSRVSSPEFENGLLFVDTPDFQIQTTEAATFSTLDPRAQVTADGLVQRVTSGAVVVIDINWSSSGTT
ncbi:MAG TPA: hypothetical protein VGD90_07910, partial [Sphingobacteriaceae bacterium]